MTITVSNNDFVVGGVTGLDLNAMVTVSAGGSNPTYLVVTGLDRNEYSAGASDATGTLTGNGASASFASIGGDGRGVGIVFTYQKATGSYVNASFGALSQLVYTASASAGDITDLSLFATNFGSVALQNSNNVYALMQNDPGGYLGSITIATLPGFAGVPPLQATPASIAAVADSFVGKAWNINGCWTLASSIAAEAGAALPVSSAVIGVPGLPSGEWIIAFDGPAGQTGNWQAKIVAGEMIAIGTQVSGHITTCVSGSGSSAMLVDNASFTNAAGNGPATAVTIAAPHAASVEWAGVATDTVVIYQLDTPVVTGLVSSISLAANRAQLLSQVLAVSDPGGKAITAFQVYDGVDGFMLGGALEQAHSAATAITVSQLSDIALLAGGSPGPDLLEVRASNGSFWGDWQTLAVGVAPGKILSPVIGSPISSQNWIEGQTIRLTLPATAFTDPNGENLTLSADLANGQNLPSWLGFNGSGSFVGTAPMTPAGLTISVTATDSSGLSVTESFVATVAPPTGISVVQTAQQVWTDGQKVAFTLPVGTFTDHDGLTATTTATQIAGVSVGSWLTYHAASETFAGIVPRSASGSVTLEVLAHDATGASAVDIFAVTFGAVSAAPKLVGSLSIAPGEWPLG